jgi:hypothetical protein
MTKFAIGQTYSTRSICDHNCIFSITIVARTAKTIKTACGKTLRPSIYDGAEQVKPFGNYSMCAIISATDPDLSGTVHASVIEEAEHDNRTRASRPADIRSQLRLIVN